MQKEFVTSSVYRMVKNLTKTYTPSQFVYFNLITIVSYMATAPHPRCFISVPKVRDPPSNWQGNELVNTIIHTFIDYVDFSRFIISPQLNYHLLVYPLMCGLG